MNIFFLGAGFSRPVGLPLGDSLFGEIMEIAKIKGLYDKTLKREIDRYIKYFHAKTGKLITESQVNLEDFMSYIDIEYHLALRGKYPTKTQEIIKGEYPLTTRNWGKMGSWIFCLYSSTFYPIVYHQLPSC